MNLDVFPDGRLMAKGESFRCALGKGGVVSAEEKKEGDGATPSGTYPLRKLYYRSDKLPFVDTDLPSDTLEESDGWCDASDDPNYNKFVKLPYGASAENLWREDDLYDLIVVVGYNDDPPVPNKGSAIFMHVARPAFTPTAGCIALNIKDLLHILPDLGPGSKMIIHE